MTLRLSHEIVRVRTNRPFAIARGTNSEYRTLRVTIEDDDGATGWGEAAPNKYYHESIEGAVAAMPQFASVLGDLDPWLLERAEHELRRVEGNRALKSALSAALHDLAGKRLGVPLYRLWGLDPSAAPRSSFTIAIPQTDEELADRVAEAAAYPILKVKLGTSRDLEIIRGVRAAAPDKILRVDANAAWSARQAVDMSHELKSLGIEFIEQPLPPDDNDGMQYVHSHSALPVIADESCISRADIPRIASRFHGINIKLSKCGGLREALAMVTIARSHGLKVMCGCMVETSLGITAAAHFAPLLDYADLDGAALLADDPVQGATIEKGIIKIPDLPGLGVTAR